MSWKRRCSRGLLMIALATSGSLFAHAGELKDLKINIPRRSKLTPVQRLNREGVEAIRKHKFSKAEKLFYKAYLYDPGDAFTLNNLGYVSELQGQIERAQRYYQLAAEQASDAVIDLASAPEIKGRPMKEAVALTNAPLQINHANVEAVRLLSQGRAPEADLALQEALKSDPRNIYTLNNMGVAKEMEGENQEALKYYDEAAVAAQPNATAVVTTNSSWRGRPVSQMAEENAKLLRQHLGRAQDVREQVAELNLRGVSAVNRNDLHKADADFRKAYVLDPNNAFTLNNIGYVYELEGDQETAQFYYEHARQSMDANAVVGVASRRTAEGKKLFAVAEDNTSRVDTRVAQERQTLQRQNEPVALRRRDNSIVEESTQPPNPSTPSIQPQQQQ
jgi:Flp pilus assembly protein TadD